MISPADCPVGIACLACRSPAPVCDVPGGCGAPPGQPCAPSCVSPIVDPNELRVVLVDVPGGTACITLCAVCDAQGRYPRLARDAALQLATDHREHAASAA